MPNPKTHAELLAHLDGLTITSENIGDIRRTLFRDGTHDWNGWVREETAARENKLPKPLDSLPVRTSLEIVKDICVEQLGLVDASAVKEESKFVDDLGADSLDTVELVMAFEEELGVEIQDEDAEKVVTVADAVTLLDRLVAEKGSK